MRANFENENERENGDFRLVVLVLRLVYNPKSSVVKLSQIVTPRKSIEDYNKGGKVEARCPGFPGLHRAKILATGLEPVEVG